MRNIQYVVHDADTANQVNHLENFIAKMWEII